MARARLVGNKISRSERVNSLPVPAALLYTWLITHLDREGRFSGNPRIVKNSVFPLQNFTLATIDKWLNQMQDLKDDLTGFGLIERYEAGGNQYLWMPGFDGEQSPQGGNKWKKNETPSDIPPPPGLPAPVPAGEPVAESDDDILDPVFKQMVAEYIANISDKIGPMTSQRLQAIEDEYPEGWFGKAMEEAVAHGKRNLKYIEAILDRWKTENVDPFTAQKTGGSTGHERIIDYQD